MSDRINNRYSIKRALGSGGMGIVYQVNDRLTQEIVALKQVQVPPTQLDFMSRRLVKSATANSNDYRISLASEFQTLASLRHPHIISVLDYGFDQAHQPFFTMTYLPDAQNFLEAARNVSLTDKIEYIQQILQALSYLHRRGVLHRDLKSENILISHGELRVLDFGLAVTQQESSSGSSGGTLAYWAPELWLGEPFTAAADLFAVGIIMFELLSGQHPFGPVDSFLLERVIYKEPQWSVLEAEPQIVEILERFLKKDPAERYQRAEEALDDLAFTQLEMVAESIDIRESYLQAATFTGREAEMAVLQDALAAGGDKQSDAQLILIGGESGVGKSRLVDEFRAHALVAGWQVLTGQAAASGGAPYQLWKAVIPSLAINVELTDLEVGVLKQIVPSLDMVLDRVTPKPSELRGKANEQRTIMTIVSLLRQQNQPILLILEDLQWADESLRPLQQVLKVAEQLPNILIIGTFRDDERPDLSQELAGAKLIQLARLAEKQIAELSQAILGKHAVTPEIIELLAQETEGNTFFIVEVMRSLAEDAGRLDDVEKMHLPKEVLTSGMRSLLKRRIDRLPEADHRLLELAAVAGRVLDLGIIEALIQDSDKNSLESWLQHASDAAVITVKENQWLFTHDKLRETILSELDNADVQAINQKVATTIEKVYPDQEAYHTQLLEHWHRADNLEREIFYLTSVLHRAINFEAKYAGGIELIERTLKNLPLGDIRHIELWNHLMDCQWRLGNLEIATQQGQEALNLAKEYNDLNGMNISHNLLGNIAREQGNYALAGEHYIQSRDLCHRVNNQDKLASALSGIGSLESMKGDFDSALPYFQQSLEIRKEENEPYLTASALSNLGVTYTFMKQYERARIYFEESIEIRTEIGSVGGLALDFNNMAVSAYHLHNYEESKDYCKKSLELYELTGGKVGIIMCLANLSYAHLRLDSDEAIATTCRAMKLAVSINLTSYILELTGAFSWLYFKRNEIEKAWELLGLLHFHSETDIYLKDTVADLEEVLAGSLDQESITRLTQAGMGLEIDSVVQMCMQDFS